MDDTPDLDLYALLGLSKGASSAEIKKAYHKAALASHPDKVPESERAAAEIKFKDVGRAYEILSDDDSRAMYDTHGMAAFDKASGGMPGAGAGADMEDILAQMFGMGMGGMGGMPGGMPGAGGGKPRVPRKGPSEEQEYEVTLEELYRGKTTRFASTKNVICDHCAGRGGKDKAKPKPCEACKGQGKQTKLQMVGEGMVTPVTINCSVCAGAGEFFSDKARCKKCKGARTVQAKKRLELYIPPGAREGERIVLAGEGDQNHPDQEPGDIVFVLVEAANDKFHRQGHDLSADLEITLAEALTGFSRVVLTHLDGRGIKLDVPKGHVIKPEEVIRIKSEGMPIKKSSEKGDLFLIAKIDFPKDGWFDAAKADSVKSVLPAPEPEIDVGEAEVDEAEYEIDVDIEEFGQGADDEKDGWEDEEEGAGGAQCAQQ